MASISRFVTISVDDGHPTDLRTAELLSKFGLKATFYTPAKNPERPVLSAAELRKLAADFELGGHTMSHLALNSLSRDKAWQEISGCKKWIEDLTGSRIASFCYPRGKFDRGIADMVREAGFAGARTCFFNLNGFPGDPFMWGVSTHAYTHSHTVQMRHALLERNFAGAWNYWRTYRGERDWARQFMLALDHVNDHHGGIAHLYMHSWEIEQMEQWNLLEGVFSEIAQRPTLVSATNGELFDLWHHHRGTEFVLQETIGQ
jgi:peptidoglycan/xylan/chitin deacetylase (PgdA/CDA1 family)